MSININTSVDFSKVISDSVNVNSQGSKNVIQNDHAIVAAAVNPAATQPVNVSQSVQRTREVVQKAAEQLQTFVQSMGRDLSFSIDPATGFHVVTVVNPSTGEVVRQLPSEEIIKLAHGMQSLNSVLVNQRA
jgi:flagellar protein FlaG